MTIIFSTSTFFFIGQTRDVFYKRRKKLRAIPIEKYIQQVSQEKLKQRERLEIRSRQEKTKRETNISKTNKFHI